MDNQHTNIVKNTRFGHSNSLLAGLKEISGIFVRIFGRIRAVVLRVITRTAFCKLHFGIVTIHGQLHSLSGATDALHSFISSVS